MSISRHPNGSWLAAYVEFICQFGSILYFHYKTMIAISIKLLIFIVIIIIFVCIK